MLTQHQARAGSARALSDADLIGLASDSLPPGCTWQVVARFPFRLIPRQGATK